MVLFGQGLNARSKPEAHTACRLLVKMTASHRCET